VVFNIPRFFELQTEMHLFDVTRSDKEEKSNFDGEILLPTLYSTDLR
jgi:hypothetical protein